MTPPIEIVVPTMQPDTAETEGVIHAALKVPDDVGLYLIANTPEHNLGVLGSLQAGYECTTAPIIAYVHDDVVIHDADWVSRVLAEFDDPSVGVVGFLGALRHGHPNLYKVPYRLDQLARFGVLSNMDDAEVHGARFTGSCDVAVIDGFAMIVRRGLLDLAGGWHPDDWCAHHIYDYLACALAHRYGFKVRLVGVSCIHHGGQTATSQAYQQWAASTKWGSDVNMHIQGHRMFYDRFADVMPWVCPQP